MSNNLSLSDHSRMQCYYNLQKARQWCNQLLLWKHHVGTMQAKLFHNVGIYWKKIATTAVSPPLLCTVVNGLP